MNKLKYMALVLILLCLAQVNAQKPEEKERLALTVWVPENIEGLTDMARSNLENKLLQLITANGVGGSGDFTRFIVSANVNTLSKEITNGGMQALTLNITLYIGDGFQGKAFSSYSTTVKGVGENDTKAYLSALKSLRTNNPEYQSFIDKGKTKIIAYYNSQCDQIIREAKVLSSMNKYDEAIYNLTSVPDVCTDCWKKAMDAVAPIFKQKIDFECKEKLLRANAIWNAGQSWEAAQEAGAIMSTIDPNATCVGEMKALSAKIEKRIKEVDGREWQFVYDYNIGLTRDLIKSYRDVGVAYGNGQAKNVTYKSLW
jgi:hypothetical protein